MAHWGLRIIALTLIIGLYARITLINAAHGKSSHGGGQRTSSPAHSPRRSGVFRSKQSHSTSRSSTPRHTSSESSRHSSTQRTQRIHTKQPFKNIHRTQQHTTTKKTSKLPKQTPSPKTSTKVQSQSNSTTKTVKQKATQVATPSKVTNRTSAKTIISTTATVSPRVAARLVTRASLGNPRIFRFGCWRYAYRGYWLWYYPAWDWYFWPWLGYGGCWTLPYGWWWPGMRLVVIQEPGSVLLVERQTKKSAYFAVYQFDEQENLWTQIETPREIKEKRLKLHLKGRNPGEVILIADSSKKLKSKLSDKEATNLIFIEPEIKKGLFNGKNQNIVETKLSKKELKRLDRTNQDLRNKEQKLESVKKQMLEQSKTTDDI